MESETAIFNPLLFYYLVYSSAWATTGRQLSLGVISKESFRNHQLAFLTPGISPFQANSLKQRRQMPKRRKNALGRPHKWQRLCCLVENFGVFLDLLTNAFFAMIFRLSFTVY
jgi:hypothetical protein